MNCALCGLPRANVVAETLDGAVCLHFCAVGLPDGHSETDEVEPTTKTRLHATSMGAEFMGEKKCFTTHSKTQKQDTLKKPMRVYARTNVFLSYRGKRWDQQRLRAGGAIPTHLGLGDPKKAEKAFFKTFRGQFSKTPTLGRLPGVAHSGIPLLPPSKHQRPSHRASRATWRWSHFLRKSTSIWRMAFRGSLSSCDCRHAHAKLEEI